MLNGVACDPELAEPVSWGLGPEGQVRAAVVVLAFPVAKLLGELSRASKDGAAIELVLVGSVTELDLPRRLLVVVGDAQTCPSLALLRRMTHRWPLGSGLSKAALTIQEKA